jgi:hypothetical protein
MKAVSTHARRARAVSNHAAFLAYVVNEANGEHNQERGEAIFQAILALEADIAEGRIEAPRGKRNAKRRRAMIVADVLRYMAA